MYGTAVGWIWGSLWSTGRVERRAGAVGVPRDAALGLPPRRRVRGRLLSSPATTRVTDRVLAHEAVHAQQWRRYGFLMPLLYLLAGRDPLRNRFEIEAGLEDGNYVPRAARALSARVSEAEALGRVDRDRRRRRVRA